VFISSPGDVAEERQKARRVIERLRVDAFLRPDVDLEVVTWDDPDAATPFLATMTPQDAISKGLAKPSDCEIVVVIFWTRMGTPLPPDYAKPDGSRYLSGTEWEYLDGFNAPRKSPDDLPFLLVYRRKVVDQLDEQDPDYAEKKTQLERVEAFFADFTNEDRSINHGYNPYETVDDFANLLEIHLRSLIKRVLEVQKSVPVPVARRRRPVLSVSCQFTLALLFAVLLVSSLYGVYSLTRHEVVMDGSFNIALAQFKLPESAPASSSEAFDRIRQTILTLLNNEYANSEVEIEPQRFGTVSTELEAEDLGTQMNADLVIYGSVEYGGDDYLFTPRFTITPRDFQSDMREITGDYKWLQESMTQAQIDALAKGDSVERARLELKSSILTRFTQALVYLTSEDLDLAAEAIDEAIDLAETYLKDYDQDIPINVIYLFGSTIFRFYGDLDRAQTYAEKAAADPAYGRAQIALGHVYYDLGIQAFELGDRPTTFNYLNFARDFYTKALSLTDTSGRAFVAEKAYLALGNTSQVLYQIVDIAQEKAKLLSSALAAYQAVLDAYDRYTSDTLRTLVAPLAAEAARQMGSMYAVAGQFSQATEAYDRAIEISTDRKFNDLVQATRSSVAISATAVAGSDS
ncbi:MAG: hypothetical protein KC547_19740, partial [Anaerolineae bacterium]|nr:hypothetical protein [Anaerolineae bacterium]